MEEKKWKQILEGNACYELDLDCVKRKEEEEKKKQKPRQMPGIEKRGCRFNE